MDSRARTRLTVTLQMKDLVIRMLIKHPRPVIITQVWKTQGSKQEGLGDTEGAVTHMADSEGSIARSLDQCPSQIDKRMEEREQKPWLCRWRGS